MRYDRRRTKPQKFEGILKHGLCIFLKGVGPLGMRFQLLGDVQLAGAARVLSKEGPSPPELGWIGISMG